ncbi:hypothetical protein ASC74_08210 [Pseudomonas sp. Root329]|nr:hypothetical protein ASC74_08210 [Pseudomonas sp. Root329]
MHEDFLSQKKPPIVQVLDGQLKAFGWGDRTIPEGVNLIQDETVAANKPSAVEAPWGGYKQSGIGRELGEWGYNNYLETKQITRYNGGAWGWYLN